METELYYNCPKCQCRTYTINNLTQCPNVWCNWFVVQVIQNECLKNSITKLTSSTEIGEDKCRIRNEDDWKFCETLIKFYGIDYLDDKNSCTAQDAEK